MLFSYSKTYKSKSLTRHMSFIKTYKHTMKSDSALSASSTATTLKKEGNSKDKRQQQGLVERKNLTYFIHWCLSLARNRCDLVSPSSPLFWALLPSGVRVCHGLVAFPALHACESRVGNLPLLHGSHGGSGCTRTQPATQAAAKSTNTSLAGEQSPPQTHTATCAWIAK